MEKTEVARQDGVHVCSKKCNTCIFRAGNLMHLKQGRVKDMVDECLENDGVIPCHKTIRRDDVKPSICRGFYDSYGERNWTLRMARGMNMIIEDDPPESM